MERSSGPPAAPQDAINNLPDAVVTEGQVSSFLGYYCGYYLRMFQDPVPVPVPDPGKREDLVPA